MTTLITTPLSAGLPVLVPAADLAAAPQWWELVAALAPVGTLAAALVAAIVGLGTIRQRSYSDRRAEFWRRTEWALEASTSQDPQLAAMGTMVLASLAKSDLIASDEELQLLDAVWIDPIAEAEEAGLDEELGDGEEDASGDAPGPDRT
ncbi:hypothetical protein [Sinomonas atrocyanea]